MNRTRTYALHGLLYSTYGLCALNARYNISQGHECVGSGKGEEVSEGVKSAPRFSVGLERLGNFNYCAAESGNVLL